MDRLKQHADRQEYASTNGAIRVHRRHRECRFCWSTQNSLRANQLTAFRQAVLRGLQIALAQLACQVSPTHDANQPQRSGADQ